MDNLCKNELFLNVLDFLYKEKLIESQKDFAMKAGICEGTVSKIKNGTRTVSDDTIRKLNNAFGGIFNPAYFRGKSEYFLISEAKEKEAQEKEKQEKEAQEKEKLLEEVKADESQPIDNSSLVNAMLAAKDETIAVLRSQINDKIELLELMRQQLKAKEQEIEFLRSQVPPRIYKSKQRLNNVIKNNQHYYTDVADTTINVAEKEPDERQLNKK